MVRRVASQVHKQVARLMRADYVKHEPVWFKAVLDHPPLPLPARAPPGRPDYDQPPLSKPIMRPSRRPITPRPSRIYYLEDDIRRQFFRDHPFEAFRPTSLIEGIHTREPNQINGSTWKRLRQRGRNPSPQEYAFLEEYLLQN